MPANAQPEKAPRRLFHAGKLTKRLDPRPCNNGFGPHEGPFIRCPEQDLDALYLDANIPFPPDGLPSMYHCHACGTTRGFSPREMRAAA